MTKNIIDEFCGGNNYRPQVRVFNFNYKLKGSLRGLFDVELASGLILHGHSSHDHFWVGLPARLYLKDDGSQNWSKVVGFRDKPTSDKFQAAVLPVALEILREIEGSLA